MKQKLFLQYLRQYTLQALERAGDNPSLAADYLEEIKKPGRIITSLDIEYPSGQGRPDDPAD